jgi:16S rRNA (guanine527-N7)-methyltransferase
VNLQDGLNALNVPIAPGSIEKLERYSALLAKWNRVYNLTAIRDADEMVTHHLLDSLSVLPHLGAVKTLADVGSGGGLPGLTLAICRPDLEVVSIEASQKKAAFQQQAKIELGLMNVSIHCGRVESFSGVFDAAISRAFAELADFVRLAGHLTRRLFAMKGVYPKAELDYLPQAWRLAEAFKLTVPGLGAERHLIILEKT